MQKMWKLGFFVLFVVACERPVPERAGNETTPIDAAEHATIAAAGIDPSVFAWARVYCTADNESHIATEFVELDETRFAPPAPPLYIGGGGGATATFFGGFEPGWGAGDREQKIYHAAPAVQWWTILRGSVYVETTDGDSRVFGAGDVIHLEDTAPCRGHISHNMSDEAAFMQFAR